MALTVQKGEKLAAKMEKYSIILCISDAYEPLQWSQWWNITKGVIVANNRRLITHKTQLNVEESYRVPQAQQITCGSWGYKSERAAYYCQFPKLL